MAYRLLWEFRQAFTRLDTPPLSIRHHPGSAIALLATVAAWEREIMLERQREGIAKAKEEGRYKGRAPTAWRHADAVRELREQGL